MALVNLSMANGHLSLKIPTISHFALAERDLTIAKLTHRGEALFACKLALAERDLAQARAL